MKANSILLFAGVLLLPFLSIETKAQPIKVPAPSPLQTLKQNFGLGDITIEYSRPSVKGRVIFGDLVPYGKVWRTGANATTKITFSDDVQLEGNDVKAGTYGIYTVPKAADGWDIMLYKDLTLGGNVADYKPENEVLRFNVHPTHLARRVETFTINIDNITAKSGEIQLIWDKMLVPIRVTSDIDPKIMKSIETAMAADPHPYAQAAGYYYDNNKDLTQALAWVNKAIQQNPTAFFIYHLKAKIQLKMKDRKGAIETAQRSMELAQDAKNEDYVTLNRKLIAEAKRK